MKKTHSIEETLNTLLNILGITVTRIVREECAGQVLYVVETPDSALFLEHGAQGMRALTTLVRQLCTGHDERFSVDINHAQRKKIEALQEQANLLARRAAALGCEVEMPPLSSYERMIVHETLKENPRVTTESRGEGRLRHVVITVR